MDARVTLEGLRKYCYFSALSDEALRRLAGQIEPRSLPAGTVIIREGEPADCCYFLERGEVEVTAKNRLGQTAALATLSGREIFGEMSLLTGSVRSATVTALTDVGLLCLAKADFERTLLSDVCLAHFLEGRADGHARFDRVKGLEPFARLSPEQAAALASRMREESYGPERDIVRQGQKGDCYYIIKSGSVGVIKQAPEERPALVAVLGEGEAFGEEALLTDSARSATVRTIEDTVVWSLDKEDFRSVLRASFLKECSPEEALTMRNGPKPPVILDVRTPGEFSEEYVPGTLNVPLDRLREKYGSLDQEATYCVLCLSGARSAIGSFLLNMHGLRALNVRGGLLDWSGPLVTSAQAGVHGPKASG